MTHPHDNIRVGASTFVYSVTKRGWVFPGLSVNADGIHTDSFKPSNRHVKRRF